MEESLRRWWGHSSLLASQKALIRSVLRGIDVVASMGPGSGKSLAGHFSSVYLTHQTHSPSFTVIISPSEQAIFHHCESLRSLGIAVAHLTSTSTTLLDDPFCLLFTTPEAFSTSRELITHRMARHCRLVSVVFEDAHMIFTNQRHADLLSPTRLWFPTVPIVVLLDLAHPSLIAHAIDTLSLRSPQLIRATLNRPSLFLSLKRSAASGVLTTLVEYLVEFYRQCSNATNGTQILSPKPSALICVGTGAGVESEEAIRSALASHLELQQMGLCTGIHRVGAGYLTQFNRDQLHILIVSEAAAAHGKDSYITLLTGL
jgi:superfamily II DNA helicase RecQ